MDELINKMQSEFIITEKNMKDIKSYLKNKYPYYQPKKSKELFFNTLNDILYAKLTSFSEEHKLSIIKHLHEDTLSQTSNAISVHDIFNACRDIKYPNDSLFNEFNDFTSKKLSTTIPKELFFKEEPFYDSMFDDPSYVSYPDAVYNKHLGNTSPENFFEDLTLRITELCMDEESPLSQVKYFPEGQYANDIQGIVDDKYITCQTLESQNTKTLVSLKHKPIIFDDISPNKNSNFYIDDSSEMNISKSNDNILSYILPKSNKNFNSDLLVSKFNDINPFCFVELLSNLNLKDVPRDKSTSYYSRFGNTSDKGSLKQTINNRIFNFKMLLPKIYSLSTSKQISSYFKKIRGIFS